MTPAVTATLLAAALACGDNAESPTAPVAGTVLGAASTPAPSFHQISAGFHHSCGIALDGQAYCWGNNQLGTLGNGTFTASLTPVAVTGGLRFTQISAGPEHTCGVATDGRAYCWGNNGYGGLGDGTTRPRSAPVAVALAGKRFRRVTAGDSHTCGVTTDDLAFCWGFNKYGQLGIGSPDTHRRTPARVSGKLHFRLVTAKGLHTCGVTTDNQAYCWGYNIFGQLGDGTTSPRRTPKAVGGGISFRQVVAGTSYSCGVRTDDRAYCWGFNGLGQLGDGTTTTRQRPVAVAGGILFSGVSPGTDHTCGTTPQSLAYCWGLTQYGQLGDGSEPDAPPPLQLSPVAVVGGLLFDAVSSGLSHTCSVTTDDRAYCWGYNENGELGDGTTSDRSAPAAVAGVVAAP